MIVVFLIFISGFFFQQQILSELTMKMLFNEKFATKILSFTIFFSLVLAVTLPKKVFFAWFSVALSLLGLKLGIFFLKRSRESQFRQNFSDFLNLVVLQIKSGKSFSQAYLAATKQNGGQFQEKLLEIYNILFFSASFESKSSSVFLNEVIAELKKTAETPQNSLKQLLILRKRMRFQENFRRKSMQMAQQSTMQALVLSPMYVGLLIYISLNFGFSANLSLILASLALFSSGLVWILSIGRSHKWLI